MSTKTEVKPVSSSSENVTENASGTVNDTISESASVSANTAASAPKGKSKEVIFTPAPPPISSPWRPVANVTASAKNGASDKWPSTLQAIEKLEKRERDSSAFLPNFGASRATSGREKWVPMKASIVVSGSRKNGGESEPQNGKRASMKKNRKNTGNARPRRPTPSQPAQQPELPENAAHDQKPSATGTEAAEVNGTKTEEASKGHASSGTFKRPAQHGNRKRFNTQNGTFKPYQQYVMYPPKQTFDAMQSPQRSFNGYRSKPFPRHGDASLGYGSGSSTPPHPFIAVNNIARQLEYYFSAENLNEDSYLRSHFTAEGYAPLSLIAKFYRVVNLSMGGDHGLILGALREIVANENATIDVVEVESDAPTTTETKNDEQPETEAAAQVEFPLEKYYVRSKQWQRWTSPESDADEKPKRQLSYSKILSGGELDQYRIEPLVFEAPPFNPYMQAGVPIPNQEHESENETSANAEGTEESLGEDVN
ncbi:LAMI_0F01068g1_1 [Lachancea mirantina]|uniref:LAMI_0F01068g1_1 n=1 Tax=Lachancea mirantina TaxID=1230905 RepID=A0A1G4JVQ3_9SACH|nr:LAMI_0F01068g1_1 [Lachancea mirantina]